MDKFKRSDVLQEVSFCTGMYGFKNIIRVIVHREDDHIARFEILNDFRDKRYPPDVFHLYIEEHHVHLNLMKDIEDFVAVRRFGHDTHIVLIVYNILDAFSDNLMIVDKHYCNIVHGYDYK